MITTNSRLGAGILTSYNLSTKDDIWQAYGKPSSKKVEAWKDCKRLCKEYDGKNLRIVGANNYFFSAAFHYVKDGQDYLMFITQSRDVPVKIMEGDKVW